MADNSWNGYENNCLFTNLSETTPGLFSDIARPAGAAGIEDGRAVVAADLDADGTLDLVVANNDAPPTLYRNRQAAGQHWIRFRLRGEGGNPTGIGARVRLEAGGVGQTRWIEAGSGYAAQAPARAHFGLGNTTVVDAVEITWPSGRRQRYNRQAIAMMGGIDRELTLVEEGIRNHSTGKHSTRNHPASATADAHPEE